MYWLVGSMVLIQGLRKIICPYLWCASLERAGGLPPQRCSHTGALPPASRRILLQRSLPPHTQSHCRQQADGSHIDALWTTLCRSYANDLSGRNSRLLHILGMGGFGIWLHSPIGFFFGATIGLASKVAGDSVWRTSCADIDRPQRQRCSRYLPSLSRMAFVRPEIFCLEMSVVW